MVYSKMFALALTASALALPPMAAQARGTDNQTKATIAGAALGAALGGIVGQDRESVLIGAAAGGLAGNAYAYHNKKMNRLEAENRSRSYRPYRVAQQGRYADARVHKKYKKPKKYKRRDAWRDDD